MSRGVHQHIEALRREEIGDDEGRDTAHAIDHSVENGFCGPETCCAQAIAQRREKQGERRDGHDAG